MQNWRRGSTIDKSAGPWDISRLKKHIGKYIEIYMSRGPSAWRGLLIGVDPRYMKLTIQLEAKDEDNSSTVEASLSGVLTIVYHDTPKKMSLKEFAKIKRAEAGIPEKEKED